MKKSKIFALVFIGFSVLIFPSYAQTNEDVCSGENLAAYGVGQRIVKAIKASSLPDLLSLINTDADRVPRLRDLEGKSFDEVIPAAVAKRILSSAPGCEPVGWCGYKLGLGTIWYDGDGIFALNLINKFEPARVQGGWTYEGKTIAPKCLSMIWLSQDNYEYLHETYVQKHGATLNEVMEKPGLFLGISIPLTGVEWEHTDLDVNISIPLAGCLTDEQEGSTLWVSNLPEEESLSGSFEYQVMATVPLDFCEKYLSPRNLKCHDVKLIHVKDVGGGSMGQTSMYNFYAVVSKDGGGTYVLPLENHWARNDAWDVIDAMK